MAASARRSRNTLSISWRVALYVLTCSRKAIPVDLTVNQTSLGCGQQLVGAIASTRIMAAPELSLLSEQTSSVDVTN